MCDVNSLIANVFSGLSVLVVEDVVDEGEVVRLSARTQQEPVPCPMCGTPTAKVHGIHRRTVADVPVGGRRVAVSVRVRRLACPVLGCPRQTLREQVPGLLERYQRRTTRLTCQLGCLFRELAGRAGARLSRCLSVAVSRSTALRMLTRLPLPRLQVPRALGVDDFALKRRHRYATILIDAETGERIDVLPGRSADTLERWLRKHPGVEIVCRDGSGAYGEAIRRALPDAVQVSDRWHIWKNLCDKTLATVRSHSSCWATVNPPRPAGVHEQTTRERWHQVHDLLGKGVGLLECARRLNLALNTVKRYARTREPEALRRAPRYRPTLVDPYRDHLRERRAVDLDADTLAGAGQLSSRLLECPLEPAEGIGNRVRPEVLGLNTAYRRPSPSRYTRESTDRHVPGRPLPLNADGRGTPTRHRPFGSEPCRHPATARALGGGRRTRPRLTERPAGEQPAGSRPAVNAPGPPGEAGDAEDVLAL